MMLRYFLILNFFGMILFSAGAQADFGTNPCVVDTTATYNITSDTSLAKIGDVIGDFTVNGSVDCPRGTGQVYALVVDLGLQSIDPLSPGNHWRCQTTVSGIAFEYTAGVGAAINRCIAAHAAPTTPAGPVIEILLTTNPNVFPKPFSRSFNLIKTGTIPAGINVLGPANPSIQLGGQLANGGWQFSDSESDTLPPGEVIGTTCSLATTVIPVDFGEATLGDSKSFMISFDSCTDQQDAVAYNNAVSLEFISGQAILPDGSALRNCTDSDCAKGLQIELQDGNGLPINLITPYKLSANNPVVGANGLDYTFNAQLQVKPSEPLAGGKIDTQLVFNTIIE